MIARLVIDVEVTSDTDPDVLAEKLLDFLGDDPDDMFPEVLELVDYKGSWAP